MSAHAILIFDIDGTLFQAHRVTVPAVRQTFAAYGLPEPEDDAITAFFGRPVEEYHAWMASLCPEGVAEKLIEDTDRRELELIYEEGRLYPDVHTVLDDLRALGYTLATSSNAPDDYMDEVLDKHDLRRRFHIIRCRGTRFDGKIAIVADILRECPGLPAIVIGDRHDDIDSAHAHGAQAIAVGHGFGSAEELAGADARIEEFSELPATVAGLLSGGLQEETKEIGD